MLAINSKQPNAVTTIFTVMNGLAAQHNAINLGQGFPDYPMDEELVSLVSQAMKAGNNQYVHTNGLPTLREALAEKVSELYNNNIHPETEVTITPGGTYAIYTAFTTILQPGDEVIVIEPAFDCYVPAIEINGAIAIGVPMNFPDYSINWQAIKEKITPKTKALILNTPHNPTGSILNETDIEHLRNVVKNTSIFIISDEVYEHLIFENKKHMSLLNYKDLYERSFVVFSFGKTYNCTGWKLGYCIAPPELTKEFRKIHQFNCFTCFGPTQHALASFVKQKEKYLQIGNFLEQKRNYFAEAMLQSKFKAIPTYGSYFQVYSYANISNKSELDFAKYLTETFGVCGIPVDAFYKNAEHNKVIRFCFAKKQATLDAALERLIKVN
jgi:methionine transaminase